MSRVGVRWTVAGLLALYLAAAWIEPCEPHSCPAPASDIR